SESTPAAPTIQSQLEAIKVIPSADRIGQLLFNNLRDKLNPRGTPAEPRYVLTVSLAESEQELLLRQDETATRINLTVTANYRLKVAAGETELTAGSARARTAYNILDVNVYYSTRTAQDSARARAAEELAEDIRERLAVYYQTHATASAPSAPPK